MDLVAPDTNPDVSPTPVRRQGSLWASIGAFLGLLVTLLPVLPPLPPAVTPWIPFVGAVLGWLSHQLAGPAEYQPRGK